METWKKFAVIFSIVIILAVVLTLLAVNFNGWGAAVSGVSGPFTSGISRLMQSPLNWALAGGYQLLIFYLLAFVAVPVAVAYAVWHYDLPYKITGATAPSPASNYDNSMRREPEEAERSPQTSISK